MGALSKTSHEEISPETKFPVCRDPNLTKSRWPSLELADWINNDSKASVDEDATAQQWLNDTVVSLRRALRGYDLATEVIGSSLTPNAALIRFRGSDDLTVSKIEKRRQELLTSHAIKVINVLAAPMEIVIMVSRPKRVILSLRDLWQQRELPSTAPNLILVCY